MAWQRIGVLLALNIVAIFALWAVMPPARWAPPGDDAPSILEAIATRHVHGSTDDYEPLIRLSQIAAFRPVVVTCGTLSVWTVYLLEQAGFEARVVTTLTLAEWDSLDNGHTLVEVRQGGDAWATYDIDRNVGYATLSGEPVTIAELVARVPTDGYRIVPLNEPVGEGYVRAVNRRLLQVPAVQDGDYYVFAANGAEAERIESYSPLYRTLEPAAWLARFY